MRAVMWVGSVVVALAAILGASQLWAESKEKKTAPRTRIAFFNLTYVVKNYDKYNQFQVEIKKIVAPYKERDTDLREQLEELRKQAEELRKHSEDASLVPAKGEERDEIAKKKELEDKAKKIQLKIEGNAEKIKKTLAEKNDEEIKTIYLDVTAAAQEYARSHDLDLVLHYNDAVTEHDFFGAPNIARKLNTGAFMPVYYKDGMDISKDVVTALNQKKREK